MSPSVLIWSSKRWESSVTSTESVSCRITSALSLNSPRRLRPATEVSQSIRIATYPKKRYCLPTSARSTPVLAALQWSKLILSQSEPTDRANLEGSVRNAPMTCCCCIQSQVCKPPQPATSALRAVDEIVFLIAVIGLIAFLTPLPDAIGEVFSGWGMVVPGLLNWLIAAVALVVFACFVLVLVASAMTGLVALALQAHGRISAGYFSLSIPMASAPRSERNSSRKSRRGPGHQLGELKLPEARQQSTG